MSRSPDISRKAAQIRLGAARLAAQAVELRLLAGEVRARVGELHDRVRLFGGIVSLAREIARARLHEAREAIALCRSGPAEPERTVRSAAAAHAPRARGGGGMVEIGLEAPPAVVARPLARADEPAAEPCPPVDFAPSRSS